MIFALTLPISNPVLIFFIVLAIILLAPILLNRIRIPHIIGLIIAGIIVGPHGFNLLARDSSFEIFGNVGILYLMFLAGLEMDIFSLRRNRKPGLIFGLCTFGIPLILGTTISHYLLQLNWATALLLSSMFASHTLISYPIVSRYGLNRYAPVTVAVAGTIFAIIGALIVFSIITGMHSGDLSTSYWLKLAGYVLVYSLFILYVYPRLCRWFSKHTTTMYRNSSLSLRWYSSHLLLQNVSGYRPSSAHFLLALYSTAIFLPYRH